MGLPAEARAHFVRAVETTAGIPAAHLDVQRYQLDLPGLIVHAEDDPVVPVGEADLSTRPGSTVSCCVCQRVGISVC
jgi:hypothetical protein